jgi:2-dehydropantoate 2-reductase
VNPGALDGDERPALVVGAGALGLLLQWLLQGPSKSTLVAKKESWERLQKNPLRVTGALEATQYLRCQTWESLGALDPLVTVFVATRPLELTSVLEALKPRLAKHATVVLCRDGIGLHEAANRVLPKTRLVRLASWLEAERWELDHVHVTGLARFELAGDPGDEPFLLHWKNVLSRPGLLAATSHDPRSLEWRRGLVAIATYALAALVEERNGALLDTPELRAIAGDLVDEAEAVAELDGVKLTSHDRAAVFQALDAGRSAVCEALRDLRAGRAPDLALANGAVVETARRHGRKAPLNSALLNLVVHLERAGHWRRRSG